MTATLFLLYRKLRSYTIKILSYCRAKFFEKQKIAFQKCTWLKKSEFAPRFRRRRCGEAAFLVNGIPFDKCREAMEDFNLRCLEKQIVGFSKRLKVSCAELIRISDKDLWNIKSEDDIVPLAYEVNEDIGSLGNYARFSKDKTKVLEAIVNLYLKKQICYQVFLLK